MFSRKSASASKSANSKTYASNTTTSTTRRTKWGSKTTNTASRQVYDKNGNLVASANSLQVIKSTNVTSDLIGSTIGLLFTILILVNTWLVLSGSSEFRGLEWLLNVMSNAPSIPTGWLESWASASIDASSWGAFSGIANFINRLSDFVNVVAFLGTGAINILLFVLYFVGSFLYLGI